MIYDVKCDPILQVSNQEPSMSSKPPTWAISAKSGRILNKLSGYLPNHISTWYMKSNVTPSSKSPIRNPQCPQSPQLMLLQPNHVGFSPNFQDIFKIIYQHDLWCQRWCHPTSLQSGTLNVLKVPNLGFISQIMSNLDQTFRIGPLATTNLIYDAKDDPILQV